MLVFAIPEWLYFANDMRQRGVISIQNAATLALLFLGLGALGGAIGWLVITKPLRDSLDQRKKFNRMKPY
jgi:hypothetical protein